MPPGCGVSVSGGWGFEKRDVVQAMVFFFLEPVGLLFSCLLLKPEDRMYWLRIQS